MVVGQGHFRVVAFWRGLRRDDAILLVHSAKNQGLMDVLAGMLSRFLGEGDRRGTLIAETRNVLGYSDEEDPVAVLGQRLCPNCGSTWRSADCYYV